MGLVALDFLSLVRSWTVIQVSLAVFYVLVGISVGKLAFRLVLFVQREFELSKFSGKFGTTIFSGTREARTLKWTIYVSSAVIALSELQLVSIVLRWLVVTLALYLVLYLLISTKDFIVNVVSALSVRRRLSIRRGEKFVLDDIQGKVIKKSVATLVIETASGDRMHVPMAYVYDKLIYKKNPKA